MTTEIERQLSRGPMLGRDLARCLGVSISTAQKMANRLVDAGKVTKTRKDHVHQYVYALAEGEAMKQSHGRSYEWRPLKSPLAGRPIVPRPGTTEYAWVPQISPNGNGR